METKISKAQLEVWEWKQALHEEMKQIPRYKRLLYIKDKVKNRVESLKKAKQFS